MVSRDFKTTSIIINLKEDINAFQLRDKRNELRKKQSQKLLDENEIKELNIKNYQKLKMKK